MSENLEAYEYALDRMAVAVRFLRTTSAGLATMRWDEATCDGLCLADELEAAAFDLKAARAPQAGEPKPVAWRVQGSGASFLSHDKPTHEPVPGATVTPLFPHPPKADPDVARLATGAVVTVPRSALDVIEAARAMPRRTPAPGGSGTEHNFKIAAWACWALDRALSEYDADSAVYGLPAPFSALGEGE